jgi:hypothetical protein
MKKAEKDCRRYGEATNMAVGVAAMFMTVTAMLY